MNCTLPDSIFGAVREIQRAAWATGNAHCGGYRSCQACMYMRIDGATRSPLICFEGRPGFPEVAAILGNSVRIVEKHYAQWIEARQIALDAR